MNTGQMILVLGAAVLFAAAALTAGDVLLASDRVAVESGAGGLGVSVAREVVTDRLALPFDTLAVGSVVDSVATPFGAFACSTRIDYVSDADPETAVAGPTDFKRVFVSVRSPHTPGPVTLAAVACDF